MKCLLCFLSDEHQSFLKLQAHNKSDRYESVLHEYKALYIDGVRNLVSVDKCEMTHKLNEEMLAYVSALQIDLIAKMPLIESVFDEVINIYTSFIQQNHILAYAKLANFINKRIQYRPVDNTHGFCKPLFRVIPKPYPDWNYTPSDENAYYHIPFSLRHKVKNQRYSISGLPMCYLADNLQTALNECDTTIDRINAIVFLPKFSNFYTRGIFDVSNRIIENLKVMISLSLDNFSKFDYSSKHDDFRDSIDQFIVEHIFYQILQYPTKQQTKGTFIQEYLLPQLLMEYIQNESNWIGVKYQSTKSIGKHFDITAAPSNKNYCFVVPYEENEDYSLRFKSNFHTALSINSTNISIDNFRKQCDTYMDQCAINNTNGYRMTDYCIYVHQMQQLVDNDEKRLREGLISDEVLQTEINMLSLLLQGTNKYILDPEKYGISKHADNN